MGEELCCLQGDLGQMGDLIPDCPDPSWLKGGCWGLEPLAGGSAPQDGPREVQRAVGVLVSYCSPCS